MAKARNKNHSTQDSRVVPHRGTNWAALRLTAQIGRDAVLSKSYGRGCWEAYFTFDIPVLLRPSKEETSTQPDEVRRKSSIKCVVPRSHPTRAYLCVFPIHAVLGWVGLRFGELGQSVYYIYY